MDFGPEIAEYAKSRIGILGGRFLPPHRGHLAEIAWAAEQVNVLFVVVDHDEAVEAELCATGRFAPISARLRERWLSEQFSDQPNIRVFSVARHPDLREHARVLEARCGHIDVVFAGDSADSSEIADGLPHAALITTPTPRAELPSAEDIRRDGVFAHWDALIEPAQQHYTKRVAFCGWESSGKSYTAEHIARVLETTAVPEYGRTYYERLNGYEGIADSQDALNTMAGHLHGLDVARGRKVMCVDTDLIYTQFYHRKDFGSMHPALDALIRANAEQIDEWIFLEPHNPLDDDGSRFRFDESERKRTSDALLDLYRSYGKSVHVIDERNPARRLKIALELVRGWIA